MYGAFCVIDDLDILVSVEKDLSANNCLHFLRLFVLLISMLELI